MKLSPYVEGGEGGVGIGIEGRRALSSMSRARHKMSLLLLLKEEIIQGGRRSGFLEGSEEGCRRLYINTIHVNSCKSYQNWTKHINWAVYTNRSVSVFSSNRVKMRYNCLSGPMTRTRPDFNPLGCIPGRPGSVWLLKHLFELLCFEGRVIAFYGSPIVLKLCLQDKLRSKLVQLVFIFTDMNKLSWGKKEHWMDCQLGIIYIIG